MIFIRLIFILISVLFIFSIDGSFAASGSGMTITGTTLSKEDITENKLTETSNETTLSEDPKINAIEKNLQKLILEFAKIQGNNSLKDITQSFKKINPDTKSLIATYTSLQSQFKRIRNNIIDEGLAHSVRGDIIIPYCDYMIDAIEKKKNALE